MARAPQEYDLQRAFFQRLVGWPDKHGIPTKDPILLPGVECWHTANGGERRDAFEGKRLKDSGVVAGVHDLLFLRPTNFGAAGTWGLLFGMEWKQPNAKKLPLSKRSEKHFASRAWLIARGHVPERLADALSDSQLEMHPRLMRAGMAASIVVDNLADAYAWAFAQMLTNRI